MFCKLKIIVVFLRLGEYIIVPKFLNTIKSDSTRRNTHILFSTDDGLMNRPKHVLQIEKYCRVSTFISRPHP